MEKFDILVLAVFIFGSAAFFAVSYCFVLRRCIIFIFDVLDKRTEAIAALTKINDNFYQSFKTQNDFNQSCIDNITKVDNKIISVLKEIDRIKEELNISPSPTGGSRSEAEAQSL